MHLTKVFFLEWIGSLRNIALETVLDNGIEVPRNSNVLVIKWPTGFKLMLVWCPSNHVIFLLKLTSNLINMILIIPPIPTNMLSLMLGAWEESGRHWAFQGWEEALQSTEIGLLSWIWKIRMSPAGVAQCVSIYLWFRRSRIPGQDTS